jgi:hypothetical protein
LRRERFTEKPGAFGFVVAGLQTGAFGFVCVVPGINPARLILGLNRRPVERLTSWVHRWGTINRRILAKDFLRSSASHRAYQPKLWGTGETHDGKGHRNSHELQRGVVARKD